MLRCALLASLAGCTLDSPNLGGGGDLNLGFPSEDSGGTLGENSRLLFSYGEGCAPGWFTVCGFDKGPVLAGATERIEFQFHGDTATTAPTFAFASSDPSVFEIGETGSGFVRVAAHQPGSATLVVTTPDGLVYDEVLVIVDAATSLAFADPTPTFFVGSRNSLPVIAKNALGTQLFGRGAIQLAAGSLLRHTGYDPAADLLFNGTDHFILSGTALGAVTVTASIGALTASVPVTIADTSAVAKITSMIAGTVSFRAETAAGVQVRGAHCEPSVTAAFPVRISEHLIEGPVPNPLLPGDLVYVSAPNQRGVATVSCALGGVVGSFALTF